MINLPFNTSVIFGKSDPKYGKKLLFVILHRRFIVSLDKWGLVQIRKGYDLHLAHQFRICNFKLAK